MLTADIHLNEFNRGLARYQTQLGLDAKLVMKKELAELVKTLVKISPPKDRSKSMRNVKAKVDSRFTGLREQSNLFNSVTDVTTSKCGLKFWSANSKYLFGGAPDSDKTKANLTELRAIYYRTQKLSGSHRIVVPFRSPRRLQRVAITTRVITLQKQVKALGNRIAKNFGRLKAGWLAPVVRGAVSLSGQYTPPDWVTRHKNGLRGDFINQLEQPQSPAFTIINRAKGVSGSQSKYFVGQALKIRAKAMKANAALILAGKKSYTY